MLEDENKERRLEAEIRLRWEEEEEEEEEVMMRREERNKRSQGRRGVYIPEK